MRAAGVQPIPDQVLLYSDGILILTVLNTRPYTLEVEWIEVAPIPDRDDVLRTDLNAVLRQGELGVFQVNASNVYSVSEASVVFPLDASAGLLYVDFYLCIAEAYSAGGQAGSHTVCGIAHNIEVQDKPYGGVSVMHCTRHLECDCTGPSECPLTCQGCSEVQVGTYKCDNYISCGGDMFCMPSGDPPGGVCISQDNIPCSTDGDCPLSCQECVGGICDNFGPCNIVWPPEGPPEGVLFCRYTETNPEGGCEPG